jgi:hypothetical protein
VNTPTHRLEFYQVDLCSYSFYALY